MMPGSITITSTPKSLDLEPHRVGERLDRVLGRVIDATSGNVKRPPIDEMFTIFPEPLLAHLRQHEAAHRQQAEHVGVELGANALVGDRLDRARLAAAGVVDEHADRALGRLDRLHGSPPRPSSVTSSASVLQPFASRSASVSGRRAVA